MRFRVYESACASCVSVNRIQQTFATLKVDTRHKAIPTMQIAMTGFDCARVDLEH